jgi:undecaprenyl-diphosphatase
LADLVSTEVNTQLTGFQGFILGIVQGLTEFLPISSTAHMKVVPVFLGWGDPGVAFTAVIQLGSIAAVLWYFWQDLSQLIRGSIQAIASRNFQAQEFRMSLGILLGTVPIVLVGIAIKLFVENFDQSPLRSLTSIAIVSIVMAILLALAEKIGTRQRDFGKLTLGDGIWIGCAQVLAIIPGVSRSGSTLTTGLFLGLERATAARFSFLLGIPAITIAGLVELKTLIDTGISSDQWTAVIMGLISAVVCSYLSIAWLLRYLQTHNAWIFVWYRLGFGVAIFAIIFSGYLA